MTEAPEVVGAEGDASAAQLVGDALGGVHGLPLTFGSEKPALSLPLLRLRWLAFHSDASTVSHYVRFSIPKKSGGRRDIWAPQPKLAAAQSTLRANQAIASRLPRRT